MRPRLADSAATIPSFLFCTHWNTPCMHDRTPRLSEVDFVTHVYIYIYVHTYVYIYLNSKPSSRLARALSISEVGLVLQHSPTAATRRQAGHSVRSSAHAWCRTQGRQTSASPCRPRSGPQRQYRNLYLFFETSNSPRSRTLRRQEIALHQPLIALHSSPQRTSACRALA